MAVIPAAERTWLDIAFTWPDADSIYGRHYDSQIHCGIEYFDLDNFLRYRIGRGLRNHHRQRQRYLLSIRPEPDGIGQKFGYDIMYTTPGDPWKCICRLQTSKPRWVLFSPMCWPLCLR